MKKPVKEWIEKAEGDYHSALREYRARNHPNYDAACFHAQQCIEKYLKGLMQHYGINFQKTHDLVVLLEALLPRFPIWEQWRDDLELLSQYAVEFRYPGEFAGREDARQSVSAAKRFRTEIRRALRLP
jgi:HEPN domain-containing protein